MLMLCRRLPLLLQQTDSEVSPWKPDRCMLAVDFYLDFMGCGPPLKTHKRIIDDLFQFCLMFLNFYLV